MIELRDYQEEKSKIGVEILRKHNIALLGFDPRVGKTFTSINIANLYGANDVLFITKKKAISSIKRDCDQLAKFQVTIINYESLHKVDKRPYDLIIIDESHNMGKFPKPGTRTKKVKEYVGSSPVIFLTGTPAPENYMQLYHQFWVTEHSPLKGRDFYEFFRLYECVGKEFDFGGGYPKKDYSNKLEMVEKYYAIQERKIPMKDPMRVKKLEIINKKRNEDLHQAHVANEKILKAIEPLVIPLSRKDAGFSQEVKHEFIYIDMPDKLRIMYNQMSKKSIVRREAWTSIASNAADRKGKMLQICGGSLRVEDDQYVILSDFKAKAIEQRFSFMDKVAIFYKFKAERAILEEAFPNHTDNPDEFEDPDIKYFLGQFASIKEGVDLKMADCIVMYSADSSASGLFQSMARLLSKDRKYDATIYWMFCRGGREEEVFKSTYAKKKFTDRFQKMKKTVVV